MKQTRKSLYSPEVYQDCLNRIDQLSPASSPEWGRMTPAQMLAHCTEVQEVTNGKELKNTPFVAKLLKGMIRNMVVGDKPFPKSMKTHPQYEQTEDRDFETEQKRLLDALNRFFAAEKESAGQRKHPLFGVMTAEEKGWSMYKHLDHHLTQFGV